MDEIPDDTKIIWIAPEVLMFCIALAYLISMKKLTTKPQDPLQESSDTVIIAPPSKSINIIVALGIYSKQGRDKMWISRMIIVCDKLWADISDVVCKIISITKVQTHICLVFGIIHFYSNWGYLILFTISNPRNISFLR